MRRPRVGIDLHTADGFYQGSRTHALQLFSRVIEITPEIDFYLFLDRPGQLPDYSRGFTLPNVYPVRMPSSNPFMRLCGQLPYLQKSCSLDLLHTQMIMPLPSVSPCMVTIHDILFESHPQYFPLFFRARSKLLMRSAAVRSKHVFTGSEYSRQEIVKRYSICPDKITVIHNGVDAATFYPGREGMQVVASRGLTPRGYILTVGRLDARKNHLALIKAYARLPKNAPDLVIVGQRDFGYEGVYESVKQLELGTRVKILENAGDGELPALYRHARLFVYPSWAEGFGIPPIEAMASGVPVICSNTTSFPEIVGDGAVLIDPGNIDELFSVIKQMLFDNVLSDQLKKKGVERARAFRWEIPARKVRDVYLTYFN